MTHKNLRRSRTRRPFVKEHRRFMLDRAIDLVLANKVGPGYIAYRAKKLKEITK